MKRRGWRWAAVLCAATLVWAQSADYKIDRALWERLAESAEASAPFFVIFKERAEVAALARLADRAARSRAVIGALQATAARSQAGVQGYLRGRGLRFLPFWIENAVYVPAGTLELARALAERPEVLALVPEQVHQVPPLAVAGELAAQSLEWNIAKIRADQVWASTTGAGLLVANIDTGVRRTHEALAARFSGKFFDPTGACGGTVCDNNGHGTHTMGTIAGSGGIGVAPGASWMACKGCVNSSCYDSHLIACAQYIADPDGRPETADFPDAVNNSWGGGHSQWFRSYVESWRALGIFPAFAAGNSGPACGSASSPGEYAVSFAAGATDASDVIAGFSGRGPSSLDGVIKPDAAAPGVNVRSSYNSSDTSYATASGTSMASPHIAGTVALIWAAQPSLRGNVAATEQLLRQTAMKLATTENCGGTAGQIPNNTYGAGRIDALAAALGNPPPNQPPAVSILSPASGAEFACPATVNFSGSASDPEDGNLSGQISWWEGGVAFGAGATASKTYSCAEAGFHTVMAQVTDSGGLSASAGVTFSIYDASVPAAPVLSATVSASTVQLRWTATAASYRLERRSAAKGKTPPGAWGLIAQLTAVAYDDRPGAGDWEYRVFGCNSASCSNSSNVVKVKVNR
jgi:subtilisin family serine protease